jgi:hypothetical protein
MEVIVQLHAAAALRLGKEHRYLLDRRLGGPQSRSEYGVEEKTPSIRRESNPDHPIVQSVVSRYADWAIPTLKRLNILNYFCSSMHAIFPEDCRLISLIIELVPAN